MEISTVIYHYTGDSTLLQVKSIGYLSVLNNTYLIFAWMRGDTGSLSIHGKVNDIELTNGILNLNAIVRVEKVMFYQHRKGSYREAQQEPPGSAILHTEMPLRRFMTKLGVSHQAGSYRIKPYPGFSDMRGNGYLNQFSAARHFNSVSDFIEHFKQKG